MSRGRGRRGRRTAIRWSISGGVAAAALVTVVAGVFLGGERARVPGPTSVGPTILLSLLASRDLGRLPSRSIFCTLARPADHCWPFQESSFNVIDTGSATEKWDMVPISGAVRLAVSIPVPVEDATGFVETTSELASYGDGDGSMRVASGVENMGSSVDSTNLVTVTLLLVNGDRNQNNRYIFGAEGADGYSVTYSSAGNLRLRLNGTSSSVLRSTSSGPVDDSAVHCVTAMMDGRTVGAGKLWVDGVEVSLTSADMSGLGSWRANTTVAFYSNTAAGSTTRSVGGVLRARVDFAALTLADHNAICGTQWQPPSTDSNPLTKLAPADVSWTQTGGERCYAASAETAICIPGGLPGYAFSAALNDIGWPVEPDRTNRVLDSRDLSTASWTGGIDGAAVAPDGSKAAATVSVTDASTLSQVAAGYAGSATLHLRVWAKCSSGTLKFATEGGAAGAWDVACATVGGAWTELHSGHAAVTEGAAWVADSTGDATLIVTSDATGVTADLWLPTLTSTAGVSVIPTAGAAVATGSIAWQVDNDPAVYYKGAAGKITLLGEWIAGGCLDIADATDIGRQFSDGVDWFAFDNLGVSAFECQLALAGVDTAVVRWNSTSTLDGTTFHAECLLNTVAQTFAVNPTSSWTAATPSTIKLDGFGSTSCTALIQTIKIEDAP